MGSLCSSFFAKRKNFPRPSACRARSAMRTLSFRFTCAAFYVRGYVRINDNNNNDDDADGCGAAAVVAQPPAGKSRQRCAMRTSFSEDLLCFRDNTSEKKSESGNLEQNRSKPANQQETSLRFQKLFPGVFFFLLLLILYLSPALCRAAPHRTAQIPIDLTTGTYCAKNKTPPAYRSPGTSFRDTERK